MNIVKEFFVYIIKYSCLYYQVFRFSQSTLQFLVFLWEPFIQESLKTTTALVSFLYTYVTSMCNFF